MGRVWWQAAAMLLAAGCSGAEDPAPAPPAAPASSPAPSPSPAWAPTEVELAAVCSGRGQPAAPARAATGPRPVRVAQRAGTTWSVTDDYAVYDLADAQVVACITTATTGTRLGWCDYLPR